MSNVLNQLRARLDELGVEALLLTAAHDLRWATGFTGSNGLLLVTRAYAHFMTDSRYGDQAAREVKGAEVHVPGYDLIGHLADARLIAEGARVAVPSDVLTLATYDDLQRRLASVTFVPVRELTAALVAVKTPAEVDKIRAAQRVTEAVFEEIVAQIRPGVSEREISAAIVYGHLRRGAERMAFEPIVGSGPNGARPHARAGDRRIEAGDLVVIDMGGVLDGYASDMTRTVAVGEPGAEARAVYEIVLEAQRAALAAARPGMPSSTLDAAARDVIAEAGYAAFFGHSLGHGIGLQTHEWPTVSFRSDAPLPAGAVVTIEPGIYLPERFGVRIEDIIVLREGGCENLTHTPKELLVLPV